MAKEKDDEGCPYTRLPGQDHDCPADGRSGSMNQHCAGYCAECEEHLLTDGRGTVYCPECEDEDTDDDDDSDDGEEDEEDSED